MCEGFEVMKISNRGQVEPFIAMDILKEANELEAKGHDIVHLEVGQPNFCLPEIVTERVLTSLSMGKLGYTVASGLQELRAAIVEYYYRSYDISLNSENVFVTTGSSAAFQLACLASFDHGASVGLASPGYPAYRHILSSLGLRPQLIPIGIGSNYQLSVDMIKSIKEPLDGLIIASPANPTGTVISDMALRDLLQYCENNGIRVISDEIYHGITYENKASTAFKVDSSSVVINSFSKYFGMTGWRIGWLVAPEDLTRSIECLAQNHYICPPTISQIAALSMLNATEKLDKYVTEYKNNRDLLLNTLPKLGFSRIAPADGAFYLYVDVSNITSDSVSYCQYLLRTQGIAMTPGVDFDPVNGHKFVRISYAGTKEDIENALYRLSK